jgi:hypothetical protein
MEHWSVRGSVHHADVQRLRALEVHVGVAAEGGLNARVHVALLRSHHHACNRQTILGSLLLGKQISLHVHNDYL